MLERVYSHNNLQKTVNTHILHSAINSIPHPVTPWEIISPTYLFDPVKDKLQYHIKKEFLVISQLISAYLGRPVSSCVLAGNIVGASTWEQNATKQHLAVTTGAGVFEASAMTYLRVKGPDAANFLNILTPRDLTKVKIGFATFVIFATTEGNVDDEAVVLKVAEDEFLLSNGGCKPSSLPLTYLPKALNEFPNVYISEPDIISFNIKGPKRSAAMLQLIHSDDKEKVNNLIEFEFCNVKLFNQASVYVVKTKIGMEMWGGLQSISDAWRYMLENPAIFTPCGWDTLHEYRMDCTAINFALYPLDINSNISIHEIGCSWMINEKRTQYIGEDVLLKKPIKKNIELKKIFSNAPQINIPPSIGTNLFNEKEELIGYVTSSAYSHSHQCFRAFTHLNVNCPLDSIIFTKENNLKWHILN